LTVTPYTAYQEYSLPLAVYVQILHIAVFSSFPYDNQDGDGHHDVRPDYDHDDYDNHDYDYDHDQDYDLLRLQNRI
jgi:hypothetical protein